MTSSGYNAGLTSALDNFTKFVNSPGGVLTAGAVLAGIVWKFFERVEAVLTEQTKLDIAAWLRGVKVGPNVEPWPDTFAKMFDRVFGEKHFTWKCFKRSSLASLTLGVTAWMAGFGFYEWRSQDKEMGRILSAHPLLILEFFATYCVAALIANVLPDYISLLASRWILDLVKKNKSKTLRFLLLDLVITIAIPVVPLTFYVEFGTNKEVNTISQAVAGMSRKEFVELNAKDIPPGLPSIPGSSTANEASALLDRYAQDVNRWSTVRNIDIEEFDALHNGNLRMVMRKRFKRSLLWLSMFTVVPAFFTSIWLWLYVGSGFLLRAARRLDPSLGWFLSKVDIEKKPLQSIGLASGAIVAVVYWAAVGISRVL